MRLYFSGPHGSGKSTLIEKIRDSSPEVFSLYPEDNLSFPKITESYFERLKSKLLRYYFESLDQQKFEKEFPQKILLCSRCVYDSVAYSKAYLQLRWIDEKQYLQLEKITATVFDNFPKRAIIVNPSLETLQKQLQQRWKSEEKKWNEENFAYLKAAQQEFSLLAETLREKALYVPEEKLEDKVKKVMQWVNKFPK